jgi:uncharacterized protein (DUF2147 family)
MGISLQWTMLALLAASMSVAGLHELGFARAHAKEPGTTSASEQRAGDGIIGEWWTEGRSGRIRFERYKNGTYRGIITYRAPAPATADNPDTDLYNPDPARRGRSTVGIVMIWNLSHEDGHYRDGYVYNARNGNTYGFEAHLIDQETLKIRGFVGFRLFGANQTWKRYHGEETKK